MYFPNVIETIGRSTKTFDLPTKLLQDRIIYIGGEINQESADQAIMQLIWLNSDNQDEPISVYINSPGGSVYHGLAIKDTMHSIASKVNTIGTGMCASMGSYLLAAGTGVRKATVNCRILIHSISSSSHGTYHDIAVDYEETKFLQESLLNDLAIFSKGKTTLDDLKLKTQRDYYMNANEAISLGLIDRLA
jgi:ATP-dependent Clp protease protease subunit